jgi:hypothetical protein
MIMPRAKKPKAQPIDSFVVQVNGEDIICEVWENSADEGTRGAHMRRKRDQIYDASLNYCETGLAGDSNITQQKISRLIDGSEPLTAFGKIIVRIAKNQGIRIEKTLSEEIAKSVRLHYAAIKKALAEIESEKIKPL